MRPFARSLRQKNEFNISEFLTFVFSFIIEMTCLCDFAVIEMTKMGKVRQTLQISHSGMT